MQRLWRKLLVTAGAAVGAAWPVERAAAQEYLGSLNYSLGIPTGDTRDFTDNESWLGLTFEGQWFVRPNASAGLLFGWNEFYQRTDEALPLENGTISGGQYRHLNVFPMLVTAKFYLNGDASIGTAVAPYAGVSTGAYYVRQLFDIGTAEFTDDGWLFGLSPELGVLFPLASGSVGMLNARYNYPFSGGNFLGDASRSFQYWTISLGVAYGR
jgi:hypothetical protein